MTLIDSTTAIVIGGDISEMYSNKTFFYNFATNTWTKGPELLVARTSHVCGMVKKNEDSDEVAKLNIECDVFLFTEIKPLQLEFFLEALIVLL